MTQRKPATKPKAQVREVFEIQVREVFEIRPLRWTKYSKSCYVAHTVVGDVKVSRHTYLNGSPWMAHSSAGTFDNVDAAKAAAEQWYRQQLVKALRRVK